MSSLTRVLPTEPLRRYPRRAIQLAGPTTTPLVRSPFFQWLGRHHCATSRTYGGSTDASPGQACCRLPWPPDRATRVLKVAPHIPSHSFRHSIPPRSLSLCARLRAPAAIAACCCLQVHLSIGPPSPHCFDVPLLRTITPLISLPNPRVCCDQASSPSTTPCFHF